jgi:CBS domain-containing protein
MTHPAATASPTASLAEVARLFDAPEVDLVLVVRAGRLVGAVGRRDLVAKLSTIPAAPIRRADAEIIAQVRERMAQEAWISTPRPTVDACHGVLALWGIVGGDEEKAALMIMARSMPGCTAVEDHLVAKGATSRYHEIV